MTGAVAAGKNPGNGRIKSRLAGAEGMPGLAAWCLFAGVLFWLWPTRVIVRSDDFGYIDSVVRKIQQGGWAQSDWLEPLNLVLPALSAALWRLGGSFYGATLGLAAAIALVNFWLLGRWLQPLFPAGRAGWLAWLGIALCPVLLNKTVEFTGVPLGLAFFLAALLAWRRRTPGLFFICVLLGAANRQSAACLLVLPAAEQLGVWRSGGRLDWRWVAGGLISAAVVAGLLLQVPVTFARELAVQHRAERSVLQFGGQLLLGCGLMGGIAAVFAGLRGESARTTGWTRSAVGSALVWLGLGGALSLAGLADLACETPWLGRFGPVVVLAAFVAAAAYPEALRRVTPGALATVAIYGLLVAWRGVWWDYYLIEPALLLACAHVSPGSPTSPRLSLVVSCTLLAGSLLWLYPLGRQLRWAEPRVVAYEQAVRTGRIGITEASEAPFGFLGWKVFPALQQRAVAGRYLSDFSKFIESGRSFYAQGTIIPVPAEPVRRSLHGSGELWPLPADYRPRPFPLNDAEWKAWLGAREP